MFRFVPNPTRPGGRRPVELITDRAKRYRARRNAPPPDRCAYCGQPKAEDVEHVDGNEGNDSPSNLVWSCRGCNVSKGIHFARNGRGIRTRQRNGRKNPAKTLAQYITAVMVLKGQSDAMELDQAIALIHDTPAADRSKFAKEIWSRRKRRQAEVPF